MYKYRRILGYALRQWPRLLLIVAATIALTSATVLQPWPLKLVVDYAIADAALPPAAQKMFQAISIETSAAMLIGIAAVASIAVYVLGAALESLLTWCWGTVNQRMTYDLASDLFRRFHQLSLLFHSRRTIGDSLHRLSSDARCVYKVTNRGVISPLQNGLILTTIAAVSWHLDPGLTMIALGAVPLMVTASFFFGRWLKRNALRRQRTTSRLMAFVQQVLTAIPLVQAFQAEDRNRRLFLKIAAENVLLSKRKVLLDRAITLLNGSATAFVIAIVIFIGGHKVLSGTLTLGSLLVFVAYIRTINSSTRGLLRTYMDLRTIEASIDRVLDVMDAKEEVTDSPQAEELPNLRHSQRGSLLIDRVNFGYEPQRPVLRDITLDISSGETLALVGPTGAGKSTLAALVPRLFDPWAGRILLDGHDIRSVTLKSLRAQVAMVLQDPFLLPLSVAENIVYGRSHATREDIVAAAVAANAHEFIQKLPQGYDTVLGDRGATLSGGQRQRVSIARALLKDAAILILDEPTSTLDLETEEQLLEALEHLKKDRTTLIIAHRLSTIRNADRIAVMENGRIVELGSHNELMSMQGLYRKFYSLQLVATHNEVSA